MAYKWGKSSLNNLKSCDKRLQDLANMMLARSDFDLTITCGFRGEAEQNDAFNRGVSKARFGQSKHNTFPSQAIDIVPYPINWDTTDRRWQEMALNAMWCAGRLNIKIRWGGTFKKLADYPHFEIEN